MGENYGRMNKNTDFSNGFASVDPEGGIESVDIGIEEGETYADAFLIFLVNGVDLRSKVDLLNFPLILRFLSYFLLELTPKNKVCLQVLYPCSQIFVTGIKKLERGINLLDFEFMRDVFKHSKVDRDYNGRERYRNYIPKIFLLYFEYHKELKVSEME